MGNPELSYKHNPSLRLQQFNADGAYIKGMISTLPVANSSAMDVAENFLESLLLENVTRTPNELIISALISKDPVVHHITLFGKPAGRIEIDVVDVDIQRPEQSES